MQISSCHRGKCAITNNLALLNFMKITMITVSILSFYLLNINTSLCNTSQFCNFVTRSIP